MKYEVYYSELRYGYAEVEANSEETANEAARKIYFCEKESVDWHSSELTDLDVREVKPNLVLLTVKELALRLSKEIDEKDVLRKPFPSCDFSIVDTEEREDLELIKSGAAGWYGIKAIDTGFDSDTLVLVSDYYGGGCYATAEMWNDGIECGEDWQKDIETMLLKTLMVQESCNPDTLLIVEFKSA